MKLSDPYFFTTAKIGNTFNTYGVRSKAALRVTEDYIFGVYVPPTAGTDGYMKYWTGSAWTLKPVKYWNGSAWVQKPVKFWNGTSWALA